MATRRWSIGLLALAASLGTGSARADESSSTGTTLTMPGLLAPAPAKPGAAAPLIGLDSGALALVPPGSAAAARNDGLAGSPSTGIDLSYIPPAERDSYLNSHDFADHLQTSRKGGHRSALSQLGGVAEGMAINGAILGIEGLTLGAR
ncbi:MAG: hypothetical protein JWO51_2305 [Rhodospirillales bacterium]|nr:hypothetical protein [Rhodospirillales bacterium]